MNIHPDTVGRHRTGEANALTLVLALPCVGAVIGSVVPGFDDLVLRGLLVVVAVGVLGMTIRLAARLLRERREDRADALVAAAWRAAHPQYVDRHHDGRTVQRIGRGVA